MGISRLFRRKRYTIQVERTISARPRTVWNHLMKVPWLDGELRWAPDADFLLWDGTRIKVRAIRPGHLISFWWIPQVGDRTPVEVHMTSLPTGQTMLRIEQRDVTTDELRRRFHAKWRNVLTSIDQDVSRRSTGVAWRTADAA